MHRALPSPAGAGTQIKAAAATHPFHDAGDQTFNIEDGLLHRQCYRLILLVDSGEYLMH